MDTRFSGGLVAPAVFSEDSCVDEVSLTASIPAQAGADLGTPAQRRGEEAGRMAPTRTPASTPTQTSAPAPAHHGEFTGPRRARFLHHLAERGNVRLACARVGISPQAAYLARRRDAVFAAGWNAALVHARDWSEQILADCATEGVREAVWYRGELVGERTKIDARLLLAHLARLDARCAEPRAELHASRFDEILALVAGETFPPRMADQREGFHDQPDPFLPMARERYAREGGEALQREAEARLHETGEGDPASEAWDPQEEAELAAEQAREAAMWAAQSCAAADRAVWDERVAAVGTALEADEDPVVSDGAWDADPAQALAKELAEGLAEELAERGEGISPRTVSTVSTPPDDGEAEEGPPDSARHHPRRREGSCDGPAGALDRLPPRARRAAIRGARHNGPGSLGVRPPSAYSARNDGRKVGRDADCAPGEVSEQEREPAQGEEGSALGPEADSEPEPEPLDAETEMRPASQPASLGPSFRIPTDGRCTPFP